MSTLNPAAEAWLGAVNAGPALNDLPVADARATLVAVTQQCGGPVEEVTGIENRTIPGPGGDIPIRIYTPRGSGVFPVIVYYHGGGWVLGDLETAEVLCTKLANATDAVVVSVDYRLAPEHPFPAAIEDATAALRWVHDHAAELNVDPERIAVSGDSAGGNLAAVTAIDARDNNGPKVFYQLLFYPATDQEHKTASYDENGKGYFLTQELISWFDDAYKPDADDWRASPARAKDLSNLAPAYVITAEFDPLRDEGEQYAQALNDAGTPATVVRADGQIHGFAANLLGAIPDGNAVVDKAAATLKTAFRQGWRPQLWL